MTLHQELVELRGRAKIWLEMGYAEDFFPLDGMCKNLPLNQPDSACLRDLMAQWPGGSGETTHELTVNFRRETL